VPNKSRFLWLAIGVTAGVVGTALWLGQSKPVQAANDRYEDYVICTGAVQITPRSLTDGVWLLDYKSGKLLGTVIDRVLGKIVGWAEVDLTSEFSIQPRQNVHFIMTTGNITNGQAAVYVAETTTGKMGVYTMGPRLDGQAGVGIRRHDMVLFRQQPAHGG
jgi:hypothetical protein